MNINNIIDHVLVEYGGDNGLMFFCGKFWRDSEGDGRFEYIDELKIMLEILNELPPEKQNKKTTKEILLLIKVRTFIDFTKINIKFC